jgi:hypothetical protein
LQQPSNVFQASAKFRLTLIPCRAEGEICFETSLNAASSTLLPLETEL